MAHLGVNGHAGVVAHALVGTASHVEDARLAAVGIAHQHHLQLVAHGLDKLEDIALTANGEWGWSLVLLYSLFRGRGDPFCIHHLYQLRLRTAQTDFIVHHLVFHRVVERSIEQHLYGLALDKAHLHDALAETAVAHHLHDDALFACLEVCQSHTIY